MKEIICQICEKHGLQHNTSHAVPGGDINQAFQIKGTERDVFLKINTVARYPEMFIKEAEALAVLTQNTPLKVPVVIAVGEAGSFQYLLLEWLHKSRPAPGFWQQFAAGLAAMHQVTNASFGWPSGNYIGSLGQENNLTGNWPEFYARQRLLPLAEKLFNQHLFTKSDMQNAESLCGRLARIFPEEPPALLHGDLWAGNFMIATDGQPAIFDPAAYYGHREMDIAMSLLFGGFDSSFYNYYNELYLLEKGWRQRVPVAQLYPLLVHAVLFGGSYIGRCGEILKDWA